MFGCVRPPPHPSVHKPRSYLAVHREEVTVRHPQILVARVGIVAKKKIVYCESIKRELKRRLIYEYRCDERLKTKNVARVGIGAFFFSPSQAMTVRSFLK
jgi:uncharacterized protein YlaI